jgi:hypothetical protein
LNFFDEVNTQYLKNIAIEFQVRFSVKYFKQLTQVVEIIPEVVRLVGRVPLVFVQRQAFLVAAVTRVGTSRNRRRCLRLKDRSFLSENKVIKPEINFLKKLHLINQHNKHFISY